MSTILYLVMDLVFLLPCAMPRIGFMPDTDGESPILYTTVSAAQCLFWRLSLGFTCHVSISEQPGND